MKEFLEDRTRTSSQTRTPGTRGRIRRRTIYIGTVVAMLAMVGGFVVASFTIGPFTNAPSQGAASTSAPGLSTVSFPAENVTMASSTNKPVALGGACTATSSSTKALPTTLVSAGGTTVNTILYCLDSVTTSGFASGQLVQVLNVTWASTTAVSTEFEVNVFISATNNVQTTAYLETPGTVAAPGPSVEIVLDLPVASDTTVTSFTVLVSQCSAVGTCPS